MSLYGQKVIAVIDTQSEFGVTIRTLKANVDTLTGQLSTLLADAPETLDTLNEIAAAISDDPAFFTTMASANTALQANIDALTTAASNARTALQAALQSDIDLRATIDTPTFTGHVFSPEFRAAGSGHLKLRAPVGNDLNIYLADQETLQITRNSGTGHPTFTANGGSGEFKFNQKTDLAGGLKLAGTDVTATAAEINAVDGRLDILEADAVTQAYVDAQVTNLVDAAPGALDTLNELAAALGDDADFATTITNNLGLKFDKTGGTLTGSLAIAKSFPDVQLKAGNEKRILFSDAGGGSTAAIKHVSTTLDFFAGGIAASNKEMSIGTDGVNVSALKIDGTAVTATAAEINAFDGRLDTLEADPTTATALAAVQADVDANETDADNAIALANVAMLAAVASVQADVDTNESDADTAIALKANAANARFTGITGINTTSPDADHPCTILGEGKYGTNGVLAIEDSTTVEAGNGGGITFKGIRDVAGNQTVYGGIRSKKDNATAGQYGAHVELVTRANGSGDTAVGFTVKSDQSCETAGALEVGGDITHNGDRFYFNAGSQLIRLKDNQTSALKIENGDGSTLDFLDFKTTNSGELLTFGAPNLFNGTVSIAGLTDAANDSAAASAGVAVNQLYRNGSVVMIRVS